MRTPCVVLLFLVAACSRDALPGEEGARDAATPGRHFRFESSAKRFAGGLAPFALAAGSLDGDGRADVVLGVSELGTDQGRIAVFAGQGDGDLRAAGATPFHRIATSWGPAVAIADLDGDGKQDIAAVRQWSIVLMRGDGRGGLAGDDTGLAATWVVAGDFDCDKDVDLLAGSFAAADGAILYRNDGRGVFGPMAPVVLPAGVRQIVAGDWNADGCPDLALVGDRGAVVRLGDRSLPVAVGPVSEASFLGAAAADFDGDGRLDLALADGQELLTVKGHGDGTFEVLSRRPLDLTMGLGPDMGDVLQAGDLDGDGRPDLLSFRGPLRNTGSGRFDDLEELPVWLARFALADVDGDRRLDIVHDLHEMRPMGAGVEVLINRTR